MSDYEIRTTGPRRSLLTRKWNMTFVFRPYEGNSGDWIRAFSSPHEPDDEQIGCWRQKAKREFKARRR